MEKLLSTLRNLSTLRKDRAYVGGNWVGAGSGAVFEVVNPSSGEVIAAVPDMDGADAQLAIQHAQAAFPEWSARTAKEREQLLKAWAKLIVQNVEELAVILTSEQGKPLSDARNEVLFAAAFVEWFAEEGKRAYGETIPAARRDVRFLVVKEPVGVCAGITPWNLPCAMVTRKAAPALAAGCTMVLKPAESTPLSALALAALAEQAGIPAGVLNVVTSSRSNAQSIGHELSTSPIVEKMSFTGSTAVGKQLLAQCAGTVKRVSMELGGNSPFIVMADADLDVAVTAAVFAKFRNSGQTCIAPNRFFVHASVHDEFVTRLLQAMAKLHVGDGFEKDVSLGPLINEAAVAKVEAHVQDALDHGATLIAGGERIPGTGHFFEPTLLTGVSGQMRMSSEETFGPVVGIARFESEQELIAQVNATRLGLAAYLFSSNAACIHRISKQLQAGIVGVNTGAIATEMAPFGGYKESGLGREGARQGLDEFMETKFICEAFIA